MAMTVGIRNFSVSIVNNEFRLLVLTDWPPAIDRFALCVGMDRSPFSAVPLDIPPPCRAWNYMVLFSSHKYLHKYDYHLKTILQNTGHPVNIF